MKKVTGFMIALLSGLFCIISATSCSGNQDENGVMDMDHKEGDIILHLNIFPLATRSYIDTPVTEMIQSLRVIIVDATHSLIEENYYVSLNGDEANRVPKPVSNFQYYYTFTTSLGKKQLYLVANEETVEDIQYKQMDGVTLPQDLPSTLSGLLNSYESGMEIDLDDLSNVMNAIYFTPNYSPDYNQPNNPIFLPYISTYEETIEEQVLKPGVVNDQIEWTTYLVPVATKFTFTFNNYRPSGVNVGGISMNYYHPDTYLFAHVGSIDLEKNFDGESLYWVDWLAKVAKASADYPGKNESFNDNYGWISNYDIPNSNNYQEIIFLPGTSAFTVPGVGQPEDPDEEIIPETVSVGPFYLTESKNTLNPNTNQSSEDQLYFLTIPLEDMDEDSMAPDFEKVAIGNLHSLFRNTSVLIRLNMRVGKVEIYAEINDWDRQAVNGWVEKGDAPEGL